MLEDEEAESVKPHEEYPLKSEAVLAVVDKYAEASDAEKFREIEEPGISDNPDEMELWEAKEIGKRKQRDLVESDDFKYTARLLWEETFSVTQNSENEFKTSPGMTIGGLISHRFIRDIIQHSKLIDFSTWDLKGNTLADVLDNEPDLTKRALILEWAERVTYKDSFNLLAMSKSSKKEKMVKDPQNTAYNEQIDTYGVRLLRLISSTLELSEKVTAKELREMVNVGDNVELTKADFLVKLWEKLSWDVLTEDSYFKPESDDRAKKGLKALVKIRVHPEFQFLYKYKSPSGYLNETS